MDLPETLIQEEVRRLIEQTAGQVAQQGVDVKKLFTQELIRGLIDSSRPEAERQVRAAWPSKPWREPKVEVAAADLEAKLTEIRRGLSDSSSVDQERRCGWPWPRTC